MVQWTQTQSWSCVHVTVAGVISLTMYFIFLLFSSCQIENWLQFCLDAVGVLETCCIILNGKTWKIYSFSFPSLPVLPGSQVLCSVISLVRSGPLNRKETTRTAPAPTTLSLMLVSNLEVQSGKQYPCQSHFHLTFYVCSTSFKILPKSEYLHIMEARPDALLIALYLADAPLISQSLHFILFCDNIQNISRDTLYFQLTTSYLALWLVFTNLQMLSFQNTCRILGSGQLKPEPVVNMTYTATRGSRFWIFSNVRAVCYMGSMLWTLFIVHLWVNCLQHLLEVSRVFNLKNRF